MSRLCPSHSSCRNLRILAGWVPTKEIQDRSSRVIWSTPVDENRHQSSRQTPELTNARDTRAQNRHQSSRIPETSKLRTDTRAHENQRHLSSRTDTRSHIRRQLKIPLKNYILGLPEATGSHLQGFVDNSVNMRPREHVRKMYGIADTSKEAVWVKNAEHCPRNGIHQIITKQRPHDGHMYRERHVSRETRIERHVSREKYRERSIERHVSREKYRERSIERGVSRDMYRGTSIMTETCDVHRSRCVSLCLGFCVLREYPSKNAFKSLCTSMTR